MSSKGVVMVGGVVMACAAVGLAGGTGRTTEPAPSFWEPTDPYVHYDGRWDNAPEIHLVKTKTKTTVKSGKGGTTTSSTTTTTDENVTTAVTTTSGPKGTTTSVTRTVKGSAIVVGG